MEEIEINNNYIDETIYLSEDGIFLRHEGLAEIKNKFELLCKTVKYLTNEDLKSNKLTINGNTIEYSTCICSCNKCQSVAVVSCGNISFGVGSSCVKKFANRKLEVQLYYHTNPRNKRCEICNNPLVRRTNGYMEVNADRNDICCYDCDSRIYLNVPFKHKDEVKKMDGIWDINNKKWYIWRSNKNYDYLNDKYGLNN